MAELTLGLVVLRTSQMDDTMAFYRMVGLAFVEEKHGSGPTHYSCSLGTTVLEIFPGSAQEASDYRGSGATLLGFNVVSLNAILETMQERGVPVVTAPKTTAWGRHAVVSDPDGRAIELNEPLPETRSHPYPQATSSFLKATE